MSSSSASQTTRPAVGASGATSSVRPLAIQWVFPASATTVFSQIPRVLGRDALCDTSLAGNETSRRHAEVRLEGPVAAIRDLASRNGVFVNARKVADAPLKAGDIVRLGDWVGVVGAEPQCAFGRIAPGWYGGSTLALAIEPARRIAPTDLPVTIQGQTGTGKEGLARAIHAWSERRGEFVAVNCGALPEALAEAELFGYRKGAFTGAERAGVGYFRAAHGGTLFLDEIIDLPLPLQSKLLRAIEQHEVCPIGETHPVQVDIRVLAASQEPLAAAVSDRRFRLDLKARLDGLTLVLPPLRDRREDVAPVFLALLRDGSGGRPPGVEPRLVEQLLLYDWPSNLRELALLSKRLLALHSTEPVLRRSHLPAHILEAGSQNEALQRAQPRRAATDDDAAIEDLVRALRLCGGNVARAAAQLGISRSRAYRLLGARPGLDLASIRSDREDT